jgi:eukaryotic-like serine/threonine-protein kinase
VIGAQLGNYRVESRLGEGGMGTVYRAVDVMLDREVALKVLRRELASQPLLVDRFRAEAVALARLRHENIAALYGLDRQGDELVMVMEYVSGETLEARIARAGPMRWQDAIVVMRGVLAALGHAHVRGVVHRDIKPANVMVDAEGMVKVMDFGIARMMGESRQTRAGVAIGTPSYMAPEQLRGEDVDGRTDLYSAGALLFELLTGRVAFQADSDYALMMQQLNDPPARPSTIVAGIPRELDAVISRAMAKRPAERFATATQFTEAVSLIEPDAVTAEPIRHAASALAARAPRDWRVYVIAACVASAAGLGAVAMRSTRDGASTRSYDADSARHSDSARASATASGISTITPASQERITQPALTAGAREVVPEVSASPVETRPRTPQRATPAPAAPTPSTRAPSRDAGPVVVAPVRTPESKTPAAAEKESAPAETESSGAVARRVQDLAARCTESIASNDAGTARRLLRGDASGLLSAITDGRITGASRGSVDVDAGDGRGEGRFTVRVAYKTPFGGNKSATARLSAEVSRSGDGWRALGCAVENGGGVR